MESFHLLRPWWLLALLPWLALCWRLWRGEAERGSWRGVCDEALLPYVLEGAGAARRRWGAPLLALGGALAILALAGPAWQEQPSPVYRQPDPLVVALDLSRSMDATDLDPSRLAVARRKVRDLLQQRRDGQTALVVFAGDAFAVTPLTDDVNTIDALVPTLETAMMPVPGTRSDRAVTLAGELLEQGGGRPGRVLLITDEADVAGLEAAAARLAGAGHRLSVIGVGTTQGAPIPVGNGEFLRDAGGEVVVPRLDEAALGALARAGEGAYARLSVDDRDLEGVLGGGGAAWRGGERVLGLSSDRWREEGPWLLLLLLPVASLAFRRGLLVAAAVVLLPAMSGPAAARDWTGAWLSADQQGARAFEAGDYQRAAAAFDDVRWKAAALYRAGRYDEAAALLAPLEDARAVYNRANALARLGRREQAMALYRQVLEREPGHEDARYNLELLRSLDPPPPEEQQRGDDEGSGEQEPKPGEGDSGDRRRADAPPQQQPKDGSNRDGEGEDAPRPGGEGEDAQPPPEPPQEGTSSGSEGRLAQTEGPEGLPGSPRDDLSEATEETQRAMKQWLRRIEDDPAGLLRRKFQYQYSRRGGEGAAADTEAW